MYIGTLVLIIHVLFKIPIFLREMDRSESRNYSRGSTDRQIDTEENNGSEESQKKDLFNKKLYQ